MNTNEKSYTNETEYIRHLEQKCQALESQVAGLQNKMDWLLEQIRLGKQKQFGTSSEKTTLEEQLSLVFNEAEGFQKDQLQEPTVEEITYKRKKSTGHKETLLEDLPTETITYELSDEEQVCPECGEKMHVMGKEVRRELKIIPAQVKVVEHIRLVYSCRNCEKTAENVPIKKATVPEPVIKGSIASPSAVAHMMHQKFVNAVPIYRQEQDYKRMGIELSRQTMSNWMNRCAMSWLEPLYLRFREELMKREVLHADETVLQVLNEPNKKAQSKSYMWLYRTGNDGLNQPVVLYDYQPSRSASHPKAFLRGFKGYLHVDGYSGYHSLPKTITICGCFAHARRKFIEALNAIPQKEQLGSQALTGKTYCDQLFAIEAKLSDLSAEERYTERLKLSKPVLDAYFAWLKSLSVLPKSALGKAVHYNIEQWKYLENYLLDGRCELSNNRAERSIKPFVIGRKNFLFANTVRGAKASAITYSIIETAKENNLNLFEYLKYLFEQLPNINFKEQPKLLDQYLPWADLPKQCYSK